MKNLLIFFGFLFCTSMNAQIGQLSIEMSADSISTEDVIKLQYNVKNLSGDFQLHNFESFDIVSGPMHSQNMSIINGVRSEESSVIFYLRPKTEGSAYIEPMFFESAGTTHEFPPIPIWIENGYPSETPNRMKKIWSSDGVSSEPEGKTSIKKKKFTKI